MANRRPMIGNEFNANRPPRLSPRQVRANRRAIVDYHRLQRHRQQLIEFAAKPPKLPVPAPVDTPLFNKLAYIILLIGVLTVVASISGLLNWAFLLYALLAVIARQPSQQIFGAALVSLVLIPLSTLVQRPAFASEFAIMAFYFLAIGLIRACLELRHAPAA